MAFKHHKYLLGIVFLSMIFLSSFVLAEGTDWVNWNSAVGIGGMRESSEGDSYGDLNNSASITSSTQAMHKNTYSTAFSEPMITGFNQSTVTSLYQNWQIVANENYIQAYDSTFSLRDEINIGSNVVGQMDIFTGAISGQQTLTGLLHDSVDGNLTQIVWQWDRTNNRFQEYSRLNISTNLNSTGLVCIDSAGAELYTCYSWLYSYNSTTANYTLYGMKSYGNGSYEIKYLLDSSGSPQNVPQYMSDWDKDSGDEWLGYTQKDLWTIDTNMNIEKNIASGNCGSASAPYFFRYAIVSNTDYASQDRLIVAKDTGYSTATCAGEKLTAYKPDLTTTWDVTPASFSGGVTSCQFSITNILNLDSNVDSLNDIVIAYDTGCGAGDMVLKIYNGKDGTTLESKTFSGDGTTMVAYPDTMLTATRLSPNYTRYNMRDVLLVKSTNARVYSFDTNQTYFQQTLTGLSGGIDCQPVDFNVDGLTDLLCTSSIKSMLFTTSAVNLNSVLSSLSVSSSTIAVGGTVNFIFNSTDYEGDQMLHSIQCSAGENYSSESSSQLASCTYYSAGVFTATGRVRDYFHFGEYSTYSTQITVTQSGTICNLNGICDAGETSTNCPSDCPVPPSQQYTSSNDTGGMPLPIQLVDVSQEYAVGQEQGFLPEIYYGTLGFLSNTLSPMIALVFVFFIVLIVIAIGYFIRTVAQKVGGISK
jgi:hypothetical protein